MLLGDRSGLEHVILRDVVERAHSGHFGNSESERAGFIQNDRVDAAELFEVKSAFCNNAAPGCAADSREDGERRARRNTTRAGDDDHRDGRGDIARDDEREHRRGERKIHQPRREPVGDALHGRARFFGLLDDLNDFAKGGVAPDFLDAHFEHAVFVDRSGEHFALLDFLDRQRLAGDRGLIDKTVAFAHHAIGGNALAGPNDDGLAGGNFVRTQLTFLAATAHPHLTRQRVDQVLDRAPPAANRVAFDQLGEEHEKRDDQRGQKLPDAKRGDERERHRQLHRHAPLAQVLPRLGENRESADERGGKRQPVARHPVPPPARQTRHDDQRHQPETDVFGRPAFMMIMLLGARDCDRDLPKNARWPLVAPYPHTP